MSITPVMYDASGVRLHAGLEAELRNQIVCEFPPQHPLSNIRDLRDSLGHTPVPRASNYRYATFKMTGQKGKELLDCLFRSNGPHAGSTSPENKQCAAKGKDVVPYTASLVIAYLLQRHDSIGRNTSGEITAAVRA